MYKKTQIGWLMMTVLFALTSGLTIAYLYQWGTNPISTIPFIVIICIFICAGLIFCSLTVSIKESTILLKYGIGLVRFKIPINELHDVQIVRIPLHYGIGIRITSKGMLYSIQGSHAVLVKNNNGGVIKNVMIGTAEPEKLKLTLENHFNNEN